MCEYRKEIERLQKMFEEVPTDIDDLDDDDSEADSDCLEVSDHNTDSEEDVDENFEESQNIIDAEDENTNELGKRSRQEFYIGKDGTKWRKQCPPKNVRTRQENISYLPGVKPYAKDAQTPLECWLKLVTPNMLNVIVENTNIYIRIITENKDFNYLKKETTINEIKAVIGILYIAGVFHGNRLNLSEYWTTDGTGNAIFPAAMGINRFRFLMKCIRFDDKNTREQRRALDKITAVRNIFEDFVTNCKLSYNVGEYVTLDEMLWSFRGRCSFRMYIANKPAKCGLKIFALVDSRTYYTTNLEIYSGSQPEGPYKISNETDDVVRRLCEPIFHTGRNVTMDNWFTGVDIIHEMLAVNQLTIVGTLRKNTKELPNDFIQSRNREIYSTLFGFSEKITILSYIPKKNKCVLMASSLHHDDEIDKETNEKRKPEIITFYNLNKGAVDAADQLCGEYNCARNTRRWPLVIFYGILNVAGLNASVIYNANQTEILNRRYFQKKLGLELMKNQLMDRAENMHLPRETRNSARKFSGMPLIKQEKTRENKRKYCTFCKRRKSKHYCKICATCICMEHADFVCVSCSENF